MNLGVTAVMLPELDFDGQIALCRSLGLRYYQYRPRIIPADCRDQPYSSHGNHKFDLTPERFRSEGAALTEKLRKAGLEPWGALPSANIDDPDNGLRLHLEGAARAEAHCVRIAPPPYPGKPFEYVKLLERAIRRYKFIIKKLARPLGIKIVFETHCRSLVASPGLAWSVCRHFDPRDLGVIFDIANFTREGAVQPNLAVSVLRDYIDCVHLGGARHAAGKTDVFGCKTAIIEACALETSDLHVPTWLDALRTAGVKAPVIIEDFTPGLSGAGKLRRAVVFLRKLHLKRI